MVRLALLCAGLLAADPPATQGPSAADLKVYEAAKTAARSDPDAQVRLALWCEAHGLQAERLKHLALAVLADPTHAAARGLMGLVQDAGKWRRPEQVAERVQADAKLAAALAEYHEKRAKTPHKADDQWKLALWCEQHGLKAEAKAHLTAVVRLDPKREAAWKRLGYKKHEGRWLTDEQVAAAKAEREAQEKADRHWKPRLEALKARLEKKDKQAEAEADLTRVTDPRAVPSIIRVFGTSKAEDQARAVQLLGQIDAPAASRALAALALFSKSEEVRRRATETLRQRDPREFADLLIALLRDPIKYEVKRVGGPGSPGVLLVEGKKFDLRRLYTPPAPPPILPGDRVVSDSNGLPVALRTTSYTRTGYFSAFAFLATMPTLHFDKTQLSGGLAAAGLGRAAGSLNDRQLEGLLFLAASEIYNNSPFLAQMNDMKLIMLMTQGGPAGPIRPGTLFDFTLRP
ncbi:MAG: HEAT repeat domain-containing protein [Isosphaeraceae bacterium]|nr:HEAT repeat domain-containing protein [Isosphaeraceae bacterium]